MLVRKCDICGHVINDEVGYIIDIFKTSMPKGTETRVKNKETSIEICYRCKQAMLIAMNKRVINLKYMSMDEEQE